VTPIYPLAKTAAAINIDGLNVNGRTKDLTLIGLGASDLDEYARDATAEQGRVIRPDPESEKGVCKAASLELLLWFLGAVARRGQMDDRQA
jgi:hypothetical protein